MDPTKTKVLGQDALTSESALKITGDQALGIIMVANHDHNLDSPTNKALVQAYNDAFHRNPDFFSVGGYDGMHLIDAALQKTGGKTDGDSLIAAAKGVSWESPRGPMSSIRKPATSSRPFTSSRSKKSAASCAMSKSTRCRTSRIRVI